MNRALPLILFAALAAGALGFFALSQGGNPGGPTPEDPAPSTRKQQTPSTPTARATDESANLATPVAAVRKPKPRTDGTAKWLEVWPMNELGQQLPEATIVAEKGSERLEGKGKMRWEGIEAGEWKITVSAEDLPTWERTLVLGNDEKRREAARLSELLRIEGQVMDVYGEPLRNQQVYLVPRGKSHPSRQDIATSRDERNRPVTGPTNGAISATTLANGRFKATLPSPGEWRLSVGLPGNAHWTQKEPFELTVGGPDRVLAIVPAQSRLTFALDTSKPAEELPSQVSAYTYDAEYAARVQFQRSERERLDRAAVDMKNERKRLAQETRDQIAKDGGKLDQGKLSDGSGDPRAVRSQKEMNMRAYEKGMAELESQERGLPPRGNTRAPIFDDGWRPVGSARFNANGEAVLPNLPGGTEVQFLFLRGRERITTQVGARLREEVRSAATVELPPMRSDAEKILLRRGEARVKVTVDAAADAAKLETGATWSVDR